MTKEWFVTHEGQQFGPVSLDDLRYEVERGKLNPRLDMIWRKDMDDWIPSGDLKGLFEKNVVAEADEKQKASAASSEFQPEESKKNRLKLKGKWGGTSRSAYLFVSFLLPFLLILGFSFGAPFLQGKIDENMLGLVIAGVSFIYTIYAIVITINRFANLSMSRWWFLTLFVPFLSIWTYSRLFSCPAGYADHKKLDSVGWLLAIINRLFIVIGIALIAATIYAFAQAPPHPETLKTPEDLLDLLKKTYAPK